MAEPTAPSPAGPRRLLRHPLVRRLPLLLVALVGLLLWRSQGSERQLVYVMAQDRGQIERVEVQLLTEDGALLKREAWFFERGAPTELVQTLKLPEGPYRAEVFITLDGETSHQSHTLHVEGEVSSVRLGPADLR
jgi:hypothetical protein